MGRVFIPLLHFPPGASDVTPEFVLVIYRLQKNN